MHRSITIHVAIHGTEPRHELKNSTNRQNSLSPISIRSLYMKRLLILPGLFLAFGMLANTGMAKRTRKPTSCVSESRRPLES